MKRLILFSTIITFILSGCSTVPETPEAKKVLDSKVDETIAIFREKDPTILEYFKDSYGYAVFPEVFKGAFLLGGARGKGQVFEQGDMIGYSSLTAATIGFSFGGEYFREIIFFRSSGDLAEFTDDEFAFSAQATAVILRSGAAAKTDYEDGKAVFIMAETGAMVDASIGGQKFKFFPEE